MGTRVQRDGPPCTPVEVWSVLAVRLVAVGVIVADLARGGRTLWVSTGVTLSWLLGHIVVATLRDAGSGVARHPSLLVFVEPRLGVLVLATSFMLGVSHAALPGGPGTATALGAAGAGLAVLLALDWRRAWLAQSQASDPEDPDAVSGA